MCQGEMQETASVSYIKLDTLVMWVRLKLS